MASVVVAALLVSGIVFPWQNPVALRAARKATLLDAIAISEQGRDFAQRDRVRECIEDLEGVNPTRRPVADAPESLSACWLLLYTTSDSILGLNRPAPFRPRPRILQHIDAFGLAAKNEEWILGGLVKNAVKAELKPRKDGKTVDVGFVQFRLAGFPVNVDPLKFKGVLETTYLDDSLRISRGDKGNLFVLSREGPPVI
jgi:hypothetical protein